MITAKEASELRKSGQDLIRETLEAIDDLIREIAPYNDKVRFEFSQTNVWQKDNIINILSKNGYSVFKDLDNMSIIIKW